MSLFLKVCDLLRWPLEIKRWFPFNGLRSYFCAYLQLGRMYLEVSVIVIYMFILFRKRGGFTCFYAYLYYHSSTKFFILNLEYYLNFWLIWKDLEGMFFWWYSTKFMFTSIVYIEYVRWSSHTLEIGTCRKSWNVLSSYELQKWSNVKWCL